MKRFSLRALLLVALVSSQFIAFGQELNPIKKKDKADPYQEILSNSVVAPNGQIRCATMEADAMLRQKYPDMPTLEEEEAWLQTKIAEYKAQQALNPSKKVVVTIPIIFHIFTDGAGAENVPQSVVINQVDQLNLDFRDLAGSPYAQSADCEIEFCLATQDPLGGTLAEPGINRITTYGQGPFTQNDFENTMKAATQWNPDNYFNVWVGNLSGGLLGYAQFPSSSGLAGMPGSGGAANTDGCVILYSSLGSVANPQGSPGAAYNKGRTLTHEAGHWIGLRHIWGDGGCTVDDFCADTPNSDGSNFGCPNTTSCGSQDMVENFMDYTDDACMNTFTLDQKTRMMTVLANSPRRGSLTTSTVCSAPNPDDAGISAIITPSGTICGDNFIPEVTLNNYGNNNLTQVDIVYDIDGAGAQTYNWTGTLTPGSATNVTLPSMITTAGPHVFNASTNNPNGVPDSNTGNDASSSNFTIVIGGELVTLTLTTDCYGEEIYWELLDGTSTVVESGGNTTGIPPGGMQIGTAQSDPGALPNESTIVYNWCLNVDCYEFIIYDDWGDGMYGTQWGCTQDGDYVIEDAASNVLAQMTATNSDFGSSDTLNFCVAAPCSSTFSSSVVEELCYGDNTGSVTITQTGGNMVGTTYDFGSGPQPSGTSSGMAQGSYTVFIVDGDNCTTPYQITLGGPTQLAPTIVESDISCNGQTDGQLTVDGNNTGTPGYTYDIGSGPQGSGTFTGLSAGNYTVTVTDANGCQTTVNGTITEPAVLAGSTGTITPEYFGSDGSVDLQVTGGTGPFTYQWSGPGGYSSTVQDPANMPGGTYSVIITDANGCTTTINNIVVPSEMGLDINGNVQFVIYPNPSNGNFNVQLMHAEDVLRVYVTDVAGRIVYELNDVTNSEFAVDLSSAANGTYMMNIEAQSQTYVKRIVLRK